VAGTGRLLRNPHSGQDENLIQGGNFFLVTGVVTIGTEEKAREQFNVWNGGGTVTAYAREAFPIKKKPQKTREEEGESCGRILILKKH